MEVKKRCWACFSDWKKAVTRTNNESLPFWISLPLPAIVEIPPPALSPPVSRTPPAPCSPGLPPPSLYSKTSNKILKLTEKNNSNSL